MAPTAGALAVGAHLVLEHRSFEHSAETDSDHHRNLTAFAQELAHGHHHHEAVPDHEHPALFEGLAPFLSRSPASAVRLDSPALPGVEAVDRPHGEPFSGRSLSLQLFTAHCSLLL